MRILCQLIPLGYYFFHLLHLSQIGNLIKLLHKQEYSAIKRNQKLFLKAQRIKDK